MARIRALSQFMLLAALSGCGWQNDEAALGAPARPPAAAIAPMREAPPLDDMLVTLEAELETALSSESPAESEAALLRAEAMTDRLLETRLPFRWIHGQQYSVDSRLRQIQSTADRAVAALLSGMPRDHVIAETRLLRAEVAALRQSLTQGGGPPRVPVNVLIEALDTLRMPQAEPAPAPTEQQQPGAPG
jgi:hypothetical protein